MVFTQNWGDFSAKIQVKTKSTNFALKLFGEAVPHWDLDPYLLIKLDLDSQTKHGYPGPLQIRCHL